MTFLEKQQQEIDMLRMILDNSFGNVFVVDNDGKVVYTNYGAAAIMGLTPQQAYEKNIYQLRDEGLADDPASIHVLENHQEIIQTVTYSTGDSLAINAKPIFDEKGNLRYVICISHNYALLERYMDSIRKKTKLYWEALDYLKNENTADNAIVAKSRAMKNLLEEVRRAAELDTMVLIYGENGSGKNSVAKLIHKEGKRANQIFLSYNCFSVSEESAEEDLFGYEQRGIDKDFSAKPGLLEMANNGTIYLEEIGNLSLSVQAKLLSALETGGFKHVGGTKVIHSNFQIIASSNRNLQKMVLKHLFNANLFYRISVFPITVPPLRSRIEDIEELSMQFLEELNIKYNEKKKLERSALEILRMYPWPGNVRELKNTIERLFAVTKGKEISASVVNSILNYNKISVTNETSIFDSKEFEGDLKSATDEFQRQYIINTMRKAGGNATEAAKVLAVSRSGLYKKISELNIKTKKPWEE